MDLQPIGTVKNAVSEAGDAAWGEVVSEIELRPELAGGLLGLDAFSHAVVVFFMHAARFDPQADLRRRPRDRDEMPLLGTFAQRAKHRPNPIGITTVKIDRVSGRSLFVRGLDAVNGTPVLDLKPHFPVFDAPSGAAVPDWVARLMEGYF
jgi:tRNA-Thr(GGU) m(6)t(6)A37 methyltransferase TsaA